MSADEMIREAGARLAEAAVVAPDFERVVRRRRRLRAAGMGSAMALLALVGVVALWPDDGSVNVETRFAEEPATSAHTIGLTSDGVWPSSDLRFTQPEDVAAAFAKDVLGWSDADVVVDALEPESCCPSLTVSGPADHSFRTVAAPRGESWVLMHIGQGLTMSAEGRGAVFHVPRDPQGTAARRWWAVVNGKEVTGLQTDLSTALELSAPTDDVKTAVVVYLDDRGVALGVVGGNFSAGPDGAPSNPYQCSAFTGRSPARFDAEAGTYAAFITDLSDSAISFDVVQWLSGDDAIEAYHRDNPDDPGGPPNDYYLLNENEQIRTAPIAGDASVWLVRLAEDGDADVEAASLEELPVYLERGYPEDVYWLTFDRGQVVDICEQYRP